MEDIRLLDSSLRDILGKINNYADQTVKGKYKLNPMNVPLNITFLRGTIEMKNNEWSNIPTVAEKITIGDKPSLSKLFDEKNLNMGLLGYGDPKEGLSGLLKWVKHNINPAKLKGDKRDLKIKVEDLKLVKKKTKSGKNKYRVNLVLRVPAKGASESSDLRNLELEKYGYVGIKSWIDEQLKKIENSDKDLDKIIYKIIKGEAKPKDKVEEVLK